jgi:hypothetical protein
VTGRAAVVLVGLASAALGTAAACGSASPAGGAGADDIRYLPATAKVVGSVDVRALRASPVFGPYEREVLRQVERELNVVRAACNLDVVAQLQRVTIGLVPVAGRPEDADATFVVRGLARGPTTRCIADLEATTGGDLVLRGDTFIVSSDGLAGRFVNDDTLVAVLTADKDVDLMALDDAIAQRGTLPANAEYKALIDHLGTDGTAWAIVDPTAIPMPFGLNAMLGDAMLGMSARVATTAALEVRVRTGSPAAAEDLRKLLSFGASMRAPRLQRFDFRTQGTAVFIDIEATANQVPDLIDTLDP